MIRVCSVTSGESEDSFLYRTSANVIIAYGAQLDFCKNNDLPISVRYNQFVDRYKDDSDDTIYVFLHDDVKINCQDWASRVVSALRNYDVIGLAGIKHCQIKEPALWHLMGERQDYRGAVAHPITNKEEESQYMITSFGPMPDRVTLVDGVFLATTKRILNTVRFSEDNPARFHYYDLDFCLECNKNKFTVGVWDIPIIHLSHGLTNANNEFERGQEWFINKWTK